VALPSQIASAARGDTKPVVGRTFPNFLDTVTDASKGQWATFTVDVITHAHRRNVPRTDLLEVLSMLGITDGASKPRGFDGKALAGRGLCSGCDTRQGLMLNGRVASHKRNGDYCPGRHQLPAGEPKAVAS